MAETDVMEKQGKVKPTLEMKQRAVKYYNENGVPKCLEGLLNKMFLDDPDDIYGYMAEYFAAHSKEPSISKIKFEDTVSSRGYNSFTGHIYCTINGLEKFVTSMQGLFDDGPAIEIPKLRSKPATGSRAKTDKKAAAAQLQMSHNQVDLNQEKQKQVNFLKTKDDIYKTALKVQGQRVKQPKCMDDLIKSLYKEVLIEKESIKSINESEEQSMADKASGHHSSSLCLDCQRKTKITHAELYFSLLSAKVSSELTKTPLYQSIHDSHNEKKAENWTLPVPLISVMKCGSEGPGKLNMVKTAYLAPKPGKSYFESFQKISAVHRDLGQCLQQKLGANSKLISSDGSYLPNLERPEQIFEFLHQACNSAGIDFEQEIDLVLDIGASYIYEEEKKKYQVSTGNFKTAEDLILMYSEFVEKYPIIGIIDGISFKDVDGCSNLCKAMSGSCYCFGDAMFEGNIEKIEDKIDEQQCFGAVVRLGNYFNNISELSQLSSFIRDKECGILIPNTTQQGCTSMLIPDMAIAIESTFIAFGAATQNETIQAVNHFIDIENQLLAAGKLKGIDSYSFPVYKEAEIPEDEHPVEDNVE